MAARIVHFGVDESFRIPILSIAGFQVEDCACSLQCFLKALRKRPTVAAIVLSENEAQEGIASEAAALAHSECKAPVVLFRDANARHEYSGMDLVIPSLTEPGIWLDAIHFAVRQSRALQDESRSLRKPPATVKEQSADARMQTRTARKRSEPIRAKADRDLEDQFIPKRARR